MSDSDEDLMPNCVLKKYQHETAGSSRTNYNNTNITNITTYSLRNNMMTPTLNMPHMHQQGFRGNEMLGFDQRSIHYRRETSPMSLRSFRDFGAQNFHNSIYSRGMSSQRSVFNGRSGSPMSMRSIDSVASVSAADIALAFKNVKFNKYDLRLIKEAYNKFMKNRVRKRIEKRRNLKLFSKGNRQRLDEDSGEHGSDSSISSDDCKSSRTILHKDNIPKSINRPLTKYDLTQFSTSMKENDIMYKNCTENLKQNCLRKMFNVNSLKDTTNHTPQEEDKNASVVTLKERFAKGASFQWPSQRFNKSKVLSNETLARNVITEFPRNKNNFHTQSESTKVFDTDSEKEEIFSQSTVKASSTHQSTMQQKRVLEDEESNSSNRKRSKTAPIKENESLSNNINIQNNDFNFKKPKMPIRKISSVKKDSVPEILIAKSRLPLTGNLELDLPNNNNKSERNNNFNDEQNSVEQNKKLLQKTAEVIEPDCSNHTEVTQNTTDVSMRPSFLKRKLFTQTLDIAESKDISSDNLATNSPQTKIYNTCREKNKVRKIVSSQSCLSRDVLSDDNVLDLIHKIVPPDQMNMTNATNKKELSKNNVDNNDKWDVASVISMCNSNEGSDTYTDEEIFKVSQISNKTNTKQVNKEVDKPTAVKNNITEVEKPQPKVNNTIKLNTDCNVVVKKLETNACSLKNDAAKSQCQNKRTVSNCVKSFWDTDFESDMEERTVTPWTSKYQEKQDNGVHEDDSKSSSNTNLNKRNFIKGSILTVRSFPSKCLNSNMKSDISTVSKQTDYDKTRQQQNNKTPNKNTKSSQNDENKAQEQVVQSSKPQKNSRSKRNLSKHTNEKPESKPVSFQSEGLNSSTRSDISRVSKQTDYDKTRQQQNNKTPNKNTKSTQNDENKAQEQVVQSSKPQKNSRSKRNVSKDTNEKPKSKPVPPKETKNKKQKSKENSECNTSRESLRLKQKKEQTEMKSTTQIDKRGSPAKGSIEKNINSIDKNSQTGNKKSKKTSNKESLKNPTIKIGNLNRTRQTPRKCNEKMQLSSSVDGSSLNISNILSRSLRLRRKNVKYVNHVI